MTSIDTELSSLRQRLVAWLHDEALPLWWSVGADHGVGGFHEVIGLDGKPVPSDRRARVQARQIFTYAVAGEMGWAGPWREAVAHGLDFYVGRYRREDGLFWNAVSAEGARPIGAEPYLYEQAFALLATATVVGTSFPERGLVPLAESIHDCLTRHRRNPAGGYTGFVEPDVFQTDPHMHLFEAALAWESVSPDPRWPALADEIAELCLARFCNAGQTALLEYFDASWAPAPGLAGRLVWPGHQFEWAGLLERWAAKRGREDARVLARRLYRVGADHGIDPARGVAVFELVDDFTVNDAKARLWSQTEWLKAAVLMGEKADAVAAARALLLYLDMPVPGLWRDKLLADGSWVDEPAPASSFYHIIDAIRVLAREIPERA